MPSKKGKIPVAGGSPKGVQGRPANRIDRAYALDESAAERLIALGVPARSRVMTDNEKKRAEEAKAIKETKRYGHSVVFLSKVDGCEVTVTPKGDVLYNVADWY